MDGRIFRENNFDDNYSIQKNVLEIKKYLEKLQSDLSKLRINDPGRRYTWREWEKKLDIVRETEHCVDLMIEIFHEENNGRPLQFGEWHGIHRYTFLIGKQICEMISRLVVHVIVNFHSSNIELHATLGKIPYKFNKVMDSYRRTSDKLLSKTTYGYMDETIHRRNINSFLKSCRDFNVSVCQETNMALEVMKNSEFRLEEGFKQLLASVVNQFHYIEKGCWLTRHLLERPGPRSTGDLETTSIPLELEFKDMLNHIKCLLINGRYALRSLSYQEYYAVEVNVVCDDIQKLTNVLQSDTRDLNDLLKVTEAMSSKICKFIDLGDKCLPEGHQQIEDVTVMYSSDFDWTFEGDEVQGSESEENGNDFEEFIEDDKDDGSITRIPEEEIKDILASSGVAKTEMINVFKMEGFNSPVKISVNNRSEFIIPEVGGKVFYKGKWISAGDAKTEIPKKKPKIKFRQYSPTRLINAYLAVKEKGTSVRKAAKQYNVSTQTLRDRVKGKVDLEKVTMGPAPLLGQEEEAMLVSHLKAMASFGYGYTRKEVTNMASDYAIQLRKRTKQQKPLTLKWFRGFMKRWPDLKVVKPRALEYQRAKSSNPGNVQRYFVELSSILTKYNLFDKPHRIFNVDEKGITLNHAPPHVVSGTGDMPQAVTTGKSSTVTILGCGSAFGVAIPPYFVFPGMRMRSELMEGSTPGAAGDVTESGWSNSVIFLQNLQSHFVHYVPGGLDEPVLLLLDGHRSHVSVAAAEWAKEHNIVLHVLPAHTSHILQPMDVSLPSARVEFILLMPMWCQQKLLPVFGIDSKERGRRQERL